ncbi:MAG: response regulator transcription factor [Clostridiales bacterium]|nr:response regulator transcription factor [Candidatus Cacconaster stercorequi]
MFNILVAEDNEDTRVLMCDLLRRAGYVPWPAANGVEALALMDHRQIDLAIVDVTMPRMDGYVFTRTLREGHCDIPIMMVTARANREDKRLGFAAGIDDYMIKPADEEELLWRIAALLRRCKSVSEHQLAVGGTVLDYHAFQVSYQGKTVQLHHREFLLLYKLLSYPKTMFTKRQLIDELWDLDTDVDEHTVEVHISRLRSKFRDNPDFELRTIRGFGYMGLTRESDP